MSDCDRVWTDFTGWSPNHGIHKKGSDFGDRLAGDVVQSKNVNSGEARVDIDESAGPIYLTWKASARGGSLKNLLMFVLSPALFRPMPAAFEPSAPPFECMGGFDQARI